MRKQHRSFSFFLSLLGLVLFSSCIQSPQAIKPSFESIDDFPKIDGSTVTLPISEAFMADLCKMSIEEVRPYVLHNKTHQAYLNLIDGTKDLIFVTSPSIEELAYASEKGVELMVVPITAEGFVFIIHKNNPISSLTFAQVQDIYSGKITNWKEVGGDDVAIKAYQRPTNSGSQTGFLDLVMKDKILMAAPTELLVQDMGGLIEAVATYQDAPDAIGYTFYYYITDMWLNSDVKLLGIDGIIPNPTSITDGTYPIHTAYYAVFNNNQPTDSPVRKVLAYILSDEGQNLLEKVGYVKVK